VGLRLLAILALVPSAIASPALAEDAPGLAPSSDWTLDYDDDSCALRRMFGAGDNEAYFEMRRFAPGSGLLVIVASKNLKARDLRTFRYRLGEETDWRETRGLKLSLDSGLGGVVFGTNLIDLPDTLDDRERELYLRSIDWRALEREAAVRTDSIAVRGVTVRNLSRGELALQLGSLEAPMAALNECVDELLTHWDIDVEAHKTLTRPALPIDLRESSGMIGYPPKMVRHRLPGLVSIRLAIDATGRVTACHIQMPLSDPEFEASSCADIQHAFAFEPALDKAGKPIASYWTTRVQFQIGPP
jgi:hypothetical protein